METIKWWQSKVTWAGIVTTLLGIVPLVAVFSRLLAPTAETIIDGAATLVAGILVVVWRVWFTNTVIATPPPDATLNRTAQ
jgi:hypothetical protein